MIIPADDYPLHQTPDPIAFAGTDRNFYDRFFFNGYDEAGDIFFAAALGVYPALNIMDAAFCVSLDGRQYNLRASKEMHMDRLNMQLGPIGVEIVSPLQKTRLVIEENEYGVSGMVEATARHAPIAEPRFTMRQGARAFMDYTRITQNIDWRGVLHIAGRDIVIEAGQFRGTRDRSWGIRPVGMRDPQSPVPIQAPQFYWLWTPANFENHSLFLHSNDDADGRAWNRRGVIVANGEEARSDRVGVDIEYAPNTRRVARIDARLDEMDDGGDARVSVAVTDRHFYMQGLGYTHPDWGHGLHHGELAVGYDEIDLQDAEAQLARGEMHYLHVQSFAEFTLTQNGQMHKGRGVVEQLILGAHKPSGFCALLDPIL